MNSSEQEGVSLRSIARTWEVDPSYVSRLFERVGIQPLPSGGYDLGAANAARERNTVPGKGQRRWARRHPGSTPVCDGCGDQFIEKYSRNSGTPHPSRFCSCSCEQDVVDGLTPTQIARRREKGISPKNPKFVQHNKWTPPPKPAPIVRICVGCGGRYDQNDTVPAAEDSGKFCSANCEVSTEAGLTREEIRRSIVTGCREGGSTLREVRAPGFFDYDFNA